MRVGRFGAYLQVGEDAGSAGGGEGEVVKPRTVSLPKDVALGQVDMAMAKKFLSLPRVVCMHPETGKEVFAGVGPYGAFVRHSTTYRSLSVADDVLSVTPERALDLLATASKSSLASQAMAHIGQLDGKNITVMNGRYGPYLKFGVVNAQIPPLYRDMPEEVPLAEAIQAIQAKADAKRGASTDLARDSDTSLKMDAFVGLMAQLGSSLGLSNGNLISTGVETMLRAKGETSRSERRPAHLSLVRLGPVRHA